MRLQRCWFGDPPPGEAQATTTWTAGHDGERLHMLVSDGERVRPMTAEERAAFGFALGDGVLRVLEEVAGG